MDASLPCAGRCVDRDRTAHLSAQAFGLGRHFDAGGKAGGGQWEVMGRLERRRGDPRLTESDREILRRITMGDLAGEFAEALAEVSGADPLLGGTPDAGHTAS
jgi:hypothetical protein